MPTQTMPSNSTPATKSPKNSAINLNASIRRVRAKWNAATRERREQAAKAMQTQLMAILMCAEPASLTAD